MLQPVSFRGRCEHEMMLISTALIKLSGRVAHTFPPVPFVIMYAHENSELFPVQSHAFILRIPPSVFSHPLVDCVQCPLIPFILFLVIFAPKIFFPSQESLFNTILFLKLSSVRDLPATHTPNTPLMMPP